MGTCCSKEEDKAEINMKKTKPQKGAGAQSTTELETGEVTPEFDRSMSKGNPDIDGLRLSNIASDLSTIGLSPPLNQPGFDNSYSFELLKVGGKCVIELLRDGEKPMFSWFTLRGEFQVGTEIRKLEQ